MKIPRLKRAVNEDGETGWKVGKKGKWFFGDKAKHLAIAWYKENEQRDTKKT